MSLVYVWNLREVEQHNFLLYCRQCGFLLGFTTLDGSIAILKSIAVRYFDDEPVNLTLNTSGSSVAVTERENMYSPITVVSESHDEIISMDLSVSALPYSPTDPVENAVESSYTPFSIDDIVNTTIDLHSDLPIDLTQESEIEWSDVPVDLSMKSDFSCSHLDVDPVERKGKDMDLLWAIEMDNLYESVKFDTTDESLY